MGEKILVVEDEISICKILVTCLEDAGYEVVTAVDGMDGVTVFDQQKPDMIITDVMMPRLNGYDFCRVIRKESDVPIIILTALDTEEEQAKGFDLLIDDYVVKPFSMRLLVKRVQAVFRRNSKRMNEEFLTYKDLKLDIQGYHVYLEQHEVIMTTKEFEIIKLLLSNQGRVYTREMLYELLWGEQYLGTDKVINTHINNIRKKLNRDYIQTVRGVGYVIE